MSLNRPLGSEHIVDIIIPTWNNPDQLMQCVTSICCHTQSRGIMRIIIVNNGNSDIEGAFQKHELIKWVHTGSNLGWEGGLKEGLKHSTAPYVMFMNDDTYIPYSSSLWLLRMLHEMRDPKVGIVGPSTNVCAGRQNIFLNPFAGPHVFETPFLIFFCALMRRADLDAVGGIDDTLPGGDDFDLSIRMKNAGKSLVVCMDAFVYHHGFQTGHRVHGTPDKPGGWNSVEMQERTNTALIRKHGFRNWLACHNSPHTSCDPVFPSRENETDVVRKLIKPGLTVELGCGATKTIEDAIGVDIIPKGVEIPTLENAISVADVCADITQPLPFEDHFADTIVARHILEHVIDPVEVLKNWLAKLKPTGQLILTVPDETLGMTIPMNPQHKHAFVPSSLKNLCESIGLKQIEMKNDYNGVSFTSVFERQPQEVLVG